MSTEYITLDDGCDYRAIAKMMTEAGYPMNHATARNVFLASMSKLISGIGEGLGSQISEECMIDLLGSQETYDCIQEVLYQAHNQLKNEGANVPC